jgi:ABC-type multidrug transport system fused ATPase/permease subunit
LAVAEQIASFMESVGAGSRVLTFLEDDDKDDVQQMGRGVGTDISKKVKKMEWARRRKEMAMEQEKKKQKTEEEEKDRMVQKQVMTTAILGDGVGGGSTAIKSTLMNNMNTLPALPTWTGGMRLRDVTFRYPTRPEMAALDGVSFTLEAYKTTALVGASGSGKSTVAALLQVRGSGEGEVAADGPNLKRRPTIPPAIFIFFLGCSIHTFYSACTIRPAE